MSSLICPKGNTNYQRALERARGLYQVPDSKHQIGFLVDGGFGKRQKVISQVLLRLFQFDYQKAASGGGSVKITVSVRRAAGDAGYSGSVSQIVPFRDDGIRIGASQGLVDLLLGIFCSIGQIKRRRTPLIGLIPETENSGRAVCVSKRGVCIINTGIQKTDQDAFAGKVENRLGQSGQDAGILQAGGA